MELTTYALMRRYVKSKIEEINVSGEGKSAYDIAVEKGFSGSEEEWLKSLKGESPHIGENGNWFVGTLDMGVPVVPKAEDLGLNDYYQKAELVALTSEEILDICK